MFGGLWISIVGKISQPMLKTMEELLTIELYLACQHQR